MRLHFANIPNFGDQLNRWLWPRLLGSDFLERYDDDHLFFGIGTILGGTIPEHPRRKIVFGSGAGYGVVPKVDGNWKFICVRGPKTTALLGLDRSLAVADPAILVPEFFMAAESNGSVGFIPHYASALDFDWTEICERAGLVYINPREYDASLVVSRITQCDRVICEAMHGAIIADAFRIPWIAARSRRGINTWKWDDWGESLGVRIQWNYFPPMWTSKGHRADQRILRTILPFWLKRLAHSRCFTTSDNLAFSVACDRLKRCVDRYLGV